MLKAFIGGVINGAIGILVFCLATSMDFHVISKKQYHCTQTVNEKCVTYALKP